MSKANKSVKVTKRAKTVEVVKALYKAAPAKERDSLAVRMKIVATAHKRTGLSMISTRSVLREIRA